MPMRKLLKAIASDISGATAVEYGLILSMIFLGVIAAAQNFADSSAGMWGYVSDTMTTSIENSNAG